MPDESNEVQPQEHDGLSRRRALGYGGAIVAGAAASQLIAENASAVTPRLPLPPAWNWRTTE